LKEILLKTEKLHHEEKHVKELEEKVAKKKASDSTLNEVIPNSTSNHSFLGQKSS
jgi:type II secretory pathway component PulM